ncbi:MAG: efflux transporter outer membrane subunit [Opitutaceae bacterium]|nr:efflux transporter outer membrane subunit [Opitutaceae bacterium]
MHRPLVPAALALLLLAGCALGPDYRKPAVPAPEAFAEPGPWKVAAPKDTLPKDTWWKIFGDPVLDSLEQQAATASPTLQAAVARRDQAWALAGVARGDYFPQVALDPSASRTRYSGHRPVSPTSSHAAYTTGSFTLPLDLSYEVDLWGRVRRANESARSLAEAGSANYQTVLLGVQADVAQTYFQVRSLEAEHALVTRSVATRREALQLVRTRFQGGASGELDVLRAETELAAAENDALALEQRRHQLRRALAVLCGQLPENFSLAAAANAGGAPAIPVGLPSELLERRPDVAAAERVLAAANAQIGIAKAAFFPSIRLIGSAGYNSSELDSLFQWDSRQWTLGPLVSLPLFQGGRTRANYQRAQAVYEEAVANYRQRVLVAFQEVENALGSRRYLDEQDAVISRAVAASRQAAGLSTLRYKSGLVSYLEVVDAERTALQNERLATQLSTQRLLASVLLVKALGGGW